MNTSKTYYVKHNKLGKITQISTQYLDGIKTNSKLIDDAANDRISVDSVFVVNGKIKKKDGTIYLPHPEDKYTKIQVTNKVSLSDVNLKLYPDNKLLKISLNPRSLRLWYNPRIHDSISFYNQNPLYFKISIDNEEIKSFDVPINLFLDTLETTIDLSDFPSVGCIDKWEISTRKVLNVYQISSSEVKNEKHSAFNKAVKYNKSETYDIILERNSYTNNIDNPTVKGVLSDLIFYVTENDMNYIHNTFTIKLKDLWKKGIFKLNYDTINTINRLDTLSVYHNSKLKIAIKDSMLKIAIKE